MTLTRPITALIPPLQRPGRNQFKRSFSAVTLHQAHLLSARANGQSERHTRERCLLRAQRLVAAGRKQGSEGSGPTYPLQVERS